MDKLTHANAESQRETLTANDGGAAFPTVQPPILYYEGGLTPKLVGQYQAGGLTKREYIATACLQGLLAGAPRNSEVANDIEGMPRVFMDVAASQAVDFADALLAKLNESPAAPRPDAAADQLEKLAAFKAYVHRRLDEAGVPADPDSPHKAEGCRIGGRLDLVLAQYKPGTAVNAEPPGAGTPTPRVAAFTPGPWKYHKTGRSWAVHETGSPGWPLAECAARGRYENGAVVDGGYEAEANARLIAAAPEMYDALKTAEDALEWYGHDPMRNVAATALKEVRAALARASPPGS